MVSQSVLHPDATIRVLHKDRDLEVMVLEVESGATLSEPALWAGPSWHVVTQGQATLHQLNQRLELLHQDSAYVEALPYTIANSAPGRLRLLTLLFKCGEEPAEELRHKESTAI